MSLDDGMAVPHHCVQALDRARRHSIDTTGALAVAHTRDGGTDLYLLVYPDRLELTSPGSLIRTGAGRERIPFTAVDSVTARDRLVTSSVEIGTGGHLLSVSTDRPTAAYLAALIRERLTAATTRPPSPPSRHEQTAGKPGTSVTETLRTVSADGSDC